MSKKTLYVAMDNALVDFLVAIKKLDTETLIKYEGRLDEVPGIFDFCLDFNRRSMRNQSFV
ncbi:MAG: 5'-nucleotidase [Maribacter sp.]|jgi:5'-nucleotidase|tara:strand:- start:755 stop:937 length:183 start_codon:yes stop_codon:yes gene_type:complete